MQIIYSELIRNSNPDINENFFGILYYIYFDDSSKLRFRTYILIRKEYFRKDIPIEFLVILDRENRFFEFKSGDVCDCYGILFHSSNFKTYINGIYPDIWDSITPNSAYRDGHRVDNNVLFYKGEPGFRYYYCSNFSPHGFKVVGCEFGNQELFFNCAKAAFVQSSDIDPHTCSCLQRYIQQFTEAVKYPGSVGLRRGQDTLGNRAKQYAANVLGVQYDHEWSNESLNVMFLGLIVKFLNNPDIVKELFRDFTDGSTVLYAFEYALFHNENPNRKNKDPKEGDGFWGVGNDIRYGNNNLNYLGKLIYLLCHILLGYFDIIFRMNEIQVGS